MQPQLRARAHFVCVSNDLQQFDRYVGGNPHLRHHEISLYDNESERIGLPTRYNEFLEAASSIEGWICFVHHDFEFHQDPAEVLGVLDPGSIYGPIGARIDHTSLSKGRHGKPGKPEEFVGEVECRTDHVAGGRVGTRIGEPQLVDVVDSCCLIIHSSLVERHRLRFDPELAWHRYCEDFSLHAWSAFRIRTYAVQIECGHYGLGRMSAAFDRRAFEESADYLRRKHAGLMFASSAFSASSAPAADA